MPFTPQRGSSDLAAPEVSATTTHKVEYAPAVYQAL